MAAPAQMIGSSLSFLDAVERASAAAALNRPVLVIGERGTGKELIADRLHRLSPRWSQTLVSLNCAALPENLIDAELFGYEPGAFTGAQRARAGRFEDADGGTLFLDEIGELPMEAQARLLRFIQEGEIRRIGSVHSRKVNVRLICATHRNLQSLAAEGLFRQDLFYRINVLRLSLPPLRERGKDILHLAERMLQTQTERLGKPLMRLSPRAIQAITTYQWPGNVRELENVIERSLVLSRGPVLEVDAALGDRQIKRIVGANQRALFIDQPRRRRSRARGA